MRTADEYARKLKAMRSNVYLDGDIVGRDHPLLQPGINVIRFTFDAAQDPEFRDLVAAESHLDGRRINRFNHIHQNSDDLLKKQEMTRKLCQQTGGCIQRCMSADILNAISVASYHADHEHGTSYYQNFVKVLQQFQAGDLVGNAAQTDVKGDRMLRPHQQKDPDLYLRVVDQKDGGIVVRGAKAHNTIAPYADEIIVVPTRLMTEKDRDWSVSFAVPADTEGLHLSIRATAPRSRQELHAPIERYGSADSITIFDDVFVPWERVFLCGEHEQASEAALLFANYHRHSYTGCKPATTDVMMGAAALVAEYNGIDKAGHVRDKLAELVAVAELVYGAGIASAVRSHRALSGTQIPNVIYTNVGRYHAGINIYHEYETVCDLAGGLPATLPFEGDFYHEKIGPLLNKYMVRREGISAEDQHRCFRFISDLISSSYGAVMQIAGVHGGGSPIMEKIAITNQYDLEEKKNIVKKLAGIGEQG